VDYFQPWELVCRHVYSKYGNMSLMFADARLLKWLEWFRAAIDRPVTVNTYMHAGKYSQRGYRCNLCSLVKDKTFADEMYLSAHTRFQAVDFNVSDMMDEEIRQWIDRNKRDMPVPVRIEKNTVGWVHVDVAVSPGTYDKIIYFTA
jgi:hypothetical protein